MTQFTKCPKCKIVDTMRDRCKFCGYSSVSYVYAVPGAEAIGPYTLEELRDLKEKGEITDQTLVSEQYKDWWVKLGVLLGTLPVERKKEPEAAPAWHSAYYTGGRVSAFFLTIGQFVSVLSCAAIVIGMYVQLAALATLEKQLAEKNDSIIVRRSTKDPKLTEAISAVETSRILMWLGGILSFCMCAALFIVFGRAKSAAKVAASQDTENQRIWRAIKEMQRTIHTTESNEGG